VCGFRIEICEAWRPATNILAASLVCEQRVSVEVIDERAEVLLDLIALMISSHFLPQSRLERAGRSAPKGRSSQRAARSAPPSDSGCTSRRTSAKSSSLQERQREWR
jgi:hypothetical protein